MFLNFLKVLVVTISILLFVNKFYLPTYCDNYSGKAEKYSDKLIDGMSKCADMKVCEIGKVSENTLGGVQIKNWKCVPFLGGSNLK